ncbi:hypothetical protein Tsubulata_003099 [Turnera subulata]|uniref:Uncharacterized protein n=1 Tax=Turnera subulata TaxID=218843 RepID=A0A9Q0G6B8_9ROSI|nr:hypothetical protein Tsubulata_003099 [Turnera subulata]
MRENPRLHFLHRKETASEPRRPPPEVITTATMEVAAIATNTGDRRRRLRMGREQQPRKPPLKPPRPTAASTARRYRLLPDPPSSVPARNSDPTEGKAAVVAVDNEGGEKARTHRTLGEGSLPPLPPRFAEQRVGGGKWCDPCGGFKRCCGIHGGAGVGETELGFGEAASSIVGLWPRPQEFVILGSASILLA